MEEKIIKMLEEIQSEKMKTDIEIHNTLFGIKGYLIDIKCNTDNGDVLFAVKNIESLIAKLEKKLFQ
jgi:hypothetical protein